MLLNERDQLGRELNRKYGWYDRGSHWWSIAHHGSLYLSAVLSTCAALVLKMDLTKHWPFQSDLASGLAAIAALLGTLAAAGGFDRKWRANRIARSKVDALRLDLSRPAADLDRIRDRLQAIIDAEDADVTGGSIVHTEMDTLKSSTAQDNPESPRIYP